MKKVINSLKKTTAFITGILASIATTTLNVFANDLTGVMESLGNYSEGETAVGTETMNNINNLSNAGYAVAVKVGLALAIIAFVVIGINFLFNNSGQQKVENKSKIGYALLGVVFIAGAVGLVGWVVAMSTTMWSK